jgi:hypothetical protein
MPALPSPSSRPPRGYAHRPPSRIARRVSPREQAIRTAVLAVVLIALLFLVFPLDLIIALFVVHFVVVPLAFGGLLFPR